MTENSRPVVVAFDGSRAALEAVHAAATLFLDRPVLVVTVWEPALAAAGAMLPADIGGTSFIPPTPDQLEAVDEAAREHSQAAAEAGARLARELGAAAESLAVPDRADVTETLVGIAEERDAAALVVGTRGLGRVKSALLGSTSRRLLGETRRPVLVVRAPD
jgi:nucleotide-binding universal stress UspA family protein